MVFSFDWRQKEGSSNNNVWFTKELY